MIQLKIWLPLGLFVLFTGCSDNSKEATDTANSHIPSLANITNTEFVITATSSVIKAHRAGEAYNYGNGIAYKQPGKQSVFEEFTLPISNDAKISYAELTPDKKYIVFQGSFTQTSGQLCSLMIASTTDSGKLLCLSSSDPKNQFNFIAKTGNSLTRFSIDGDKIYFLEPRSQNNFVVRLAATSISSLSEIKDVVGATKAPFTISKTSTLFRVRQGKYFYYENKQLNYGQTLTDGSFNAPTTTPCADDLSLSLIHADYVLTDCSSDRSHGNI